MHGRSVEDIEPDIRFMRVRRVLSQILVAVLFYSQTAIVGAQTPLASNKVLIRDGTDVKLRFTERLSSKTAQAGDSISLVLAEDLRVDGITVVTEGAKALGQITVAQKAGMLGKGGDLALQLLYLDAGDDRIKLRGNKGQEGASQVGAAIALTVFVGIFGLLKHGKDAEIPAGTTITAYVMDDTTIVASSKYAPSQPPSTAYTSAVVQPPAAISAPAEQTTPPSLEATARPPAAPVSTQISLKPITDSDVIALESAGLSDELVIAKIQLTPASFQLDTKDIIALKKANVSEAVIQAMMAATGPVRELASVAPTAEFPRITTAPTPPPTPSQQTSSPTASAPAPPKTGLLAKLKKVMADPTDERKPAAPPTCSAEPPVPAQYALTSVTVLSKPAGARISVDGYPAGVTPAVVKLVPGTYKLTLQAEGFAAYTQQITVEPGQVSSFGVALDTSK